MANLILELRRRNVLRVAAFYAAAGWVLVQVATQVFPFFDIPNAVVRWVVIAIVCGFPLALVLSWVYELTPQGLKRESELAANDPVHREGARRLDRWIIIALSLAVVVLLAGLLLGRRPAAPEEARAAPGKSIAVLPFENLSDDKSNAWFAQGMQDEILTRLSRVGELKVISRSSTQHYGSNPDNLSEVARQLGVANILEGSVQKAGDKVHVNVQLIEASSGAHLWADIYDRKLDDIFGVEGEVAQAIASALQARLNGGEQKAMMMRPTGNPAAYEAYQRGRAHEMRSFNAFAMEDLHRTEADYAEAVRLDPDFAQAWARLAIVRSYLYVGQFPQSPELLAQAKAAADTALRLRPDLGDAYLAQGYYHYRGLLDFAGGLDWFNQALQRLPNSAEVLAAIAYIERRQGKWAESTAHLEQAIALDPRNTSTLSGLALNYQSLRQYQKALDTADRALAVSPKDDDLVIGKAKIYALKGDYDAASRLLDPYPLQPVQPGLYLERVKILLNQRHFAEAITRLEAAANDPNPAFADRRPAFNLFLGLAHVFDGHPEAAQAPCQLALKQFQSDASALAPPDAAATESGIRLCLRQYPEALSLARKAVELDAADALSRPGSELILAITLAVSGDHDAALDLLGKLMQEPGGATINDLRNPVWDGLRSDPRFQKLLADAEAESR